MVPDQLPRIAETKRLRLQGGTVLLSPQAFSSTCSAADAAACSAADDWPGTLVFLAHLVLTLVLSPCIMCE